MLKRKSLISTREWEIEDIELLISLAKDIKKWRYAGNVPKFLKDRSLFMLYCNEAIRARICVGAAVDILGGRVHFINLPTLDEERIVDIARICGKAGSAIVMELSEEAIKHPYGFGNSVVRRCAERIDVPVLNLGDEKFNPVQAISDMLTIKEKLGDDVRGKKCVITWIYSDEVRSRGAVQDDILIATRYAMDVILAFPPGFELDEDLMLKAKESADEYGGSFKVERDFKQALIGAQVLILRSWASKECVKLGLNKFGGDREVEVRDKYMDWLLTPDLMDLADRNVVVIHDLPISRGKGATMAIINGPLSVALDQVENSVYVSAAALALLTADRQV